MDTSHEGVQILTIRSFVLIIYQARRKVWKSGGAGSTVVGIICPPVEIGLTDLLKPEGGGARKYSPGSDSPDCMEGRRPEKQRL